MAPKLDASSAISDRRTSIACWTDCCRDADIFDETDDSRFGLIGPEAIMVFFSETDDSRFGLIGSEAIMVFFSETDDSRFGLIGSEAIMVSVTSELSGRSS
jgi:hypothetical protein